jgi:hypothetical protein
MGEREGLIRARYAVSILRVARGSPAKDALKLVDGLAAELLSMELDGELTESRVNLLYACEYLSAALRLGSPTRMAWDRATNAAAAWMALLEAN